MASDRDDDPRARLEPLRTELGQIDREILALVARRQAVAQKIGQVKRDAGIPTRDFRQERDVVERRRARRGAPLRADPLALGEELMLDAASTRLADGARAGHRRGARRRRWPARARDRGRLGPHGPLVRARPAGAGLRRGDRGSGRRPVDGVRCHADWRAAETPGGVLEHELVVVAAPMPVTAAILEELATRAYRAAWCSTLGSLKSPLRRGLHHAARGRRARVSERAPDVRPRHAAARAGAT